MRGNVLAATMEGSETPRTAIFAWLSLVLEKMAKQQKPRDLQGDKRAGNQNAEDERSLAHTHSPSRRFETIAVAGNEDFLRRVQFGFELADCGIAIRGIALHRVQHDLFGLS